MDCDATAIVGNLDPDLVLPRIHSAPDGDPAVFFNGVQCIEQKVDKNLFDLVFV